MSTMSSSVCPDGFVHVEDVIPDVLPEIRYYSSFNFVGTRIDGYERPTALLTAAAAKALKAVGDDLRRRGFLLRIFDAYRPRRAVAHFVRWAADPDDVRMKPYFYPNVDKHELFERGYIVKKSAHTRGSTVDLTLFDPAGGRDVDMGSSFDKFGRESHSDWCGDPETGKYIGDFSGDTVPKGGQINAVQFDHRMLLRSVMMRHGFVPLAEEWWHFTLADEPYPETYFDFPVR